MKEANNMTKSIALVEPISEVIVGVDTHKLVHVAVAINLSRSPTRDGHRAG